MEQYWVLTPRETAMVFEAWEWRQEQEQRRDVTIAWLTAGLSRAKRLPPLAELLGERGTKVLTEEQAAERRREFEELKERFKGLASHRPSRTVRVETRN